jgi:hypothetical protein
LSGARVFAVGGAALMAGILHRFGRRLAAGFHRPREA